MLGCGLNNSYLKCGSIEYYQNRKGKHKRLKDEISTPEDIHREIIAKWEEYLQV